MKVSAKAEYACIAMIELASQFGSGEPISVRKIAERHGISPRFLVQILLRLKRAGLVDSTRGSTGGYYLVKPPDQASLGDVMEVVAGSSDENGQTTNASPDSPAVKVLLQAWKRVGDVEHALLRNITFSELLERAKEQDGQTYYS